MIDFRIKEELVQPPMATGFMRERKAIPPFHGWVYLRIKTCIDQDCAVAKDRAQDIRLDAEATARDIKAHMQIFYLESQLEMLLDNVVDWDRRLQDKAPFLFKFGQQGFGVKLNGFFRKKRDRSVHQSSFICIGALLQLSHIFLRLASVISHAGKVVGIQPFDGSEQG